MATVVNSFALDGVNAYPVIVETVTLHGQPSVNIVGLGDAAVKEAAQRLQAALSCGAFDFPKLKVVINLAPSGMKKSGSHFDLAMAVSLLHEDGQILALKEDLMGIAFIGELSLNAELRPVRGVLPMAITARESGLKKLFVPVENYGEANLVKGIEVYAFKTLFEVVDYLRGTFEYQPPVFSQAVRPPSATDGLDFFDVRGQEVLIEYTVVAVAGGHNILMIGPPDCGKSMIAKRIPTIMPALSEEEALEITRIYSVTGHLRECGYLIQDRPFRTPHHNASTNALVGGGSPVVPGEISLAHNGVLFLDEIAEFNKKALDALRQPMEDKVVTVSRVNSTGTFPANFMLVSAMNPCPCGYYGQARCRCTDYEVLKYRQKISGPILDRIEVHKYVQSVSFLNPSEEDHGPRSADLRDRVQKARDIQQLRFAGVPYINSNAQMNEAMIKEFCSLDSDSNRLLSLAFEKFQYSARTYNKFLKIARTFADLDASEHIRKQDVSGALMARDMDKDRSGMLVV
ncbi:MAG TPA: YifB family Mg chelatase-like AAA ATPase [Desulfosporosinus sp.]|nr:YifB family Mg chelatase-like AAA ATPase [Desulfosporosinus sp.]